MKTALIAFISSYLILCSSKAYSQDDYKWDVELATGFDTNQDWEFAIYGTHHFNEYIAYNFGVKYIKQYGSNLNVSNHIFDKYLTALNDDNADQIENIALYTGVRFSTPVLFKYGKEDEYTFRLNVEPGLFILTTTDKGKDVEYDKGKSYTSKNGKTFFLSNRTFLSLNVADSFIISAGYQISNLDIYSGYRNVMAGNVRLGNFLPSPILMHTFYASIAIVL